MFCICFVIECGNDHRLCIKQLLYFITYQVVDGLHVELFYKCFLNTVDHSQLFTLLY